MNRTEQNKKHPRWRTVRTQRESARENCFLCLKFSEKGNHFWTEFGQILRFKIIDTKLYLKSGQNDDGCRIFGINGQFLCSFV